MFRKFVKTSVVVCSTILISGCAWFGMGGEEKTRQSANDPLVMQGELKKKNTGTSRSTQRTSPNQQNKNTPTLRRKKSTSDQARSSGSAEPQITPQLKQRPRKSASDYAAKGKQAYENKNYKKAIKKYKKAVQLDSSNPEYYFNLGSLHYMRKNYQKARNYYQQTIRLNQNHEMAHLYLGATYLRLGNRASARKHFNRVLEINPNNQKAQQYLNQM